MPLPMVDYEASLPIGTINLRYITWPHWSVSVLVLVLGFAAKN